MTENKINNISKDMILYQDLHNYIRLLKRYKCEKISTLGFIQSFFRIYNEGYKRWMEIAENHEELILLDINKKALKFDAEVLIYFEDKCHRIAENIMSSTLTPEDEVELKDWSELMLDEMQTYW